jgi:hypothetical protein
MRICHVRGLGTVKVELAAHDAFVRSSGGNRIHYSELKGVCVGYFYL